MTQEQKGNFHECHDWILFPHSLPALTVVQQLTEVQPMQEAYIPRVLYREAQ